MKRPVVAIGVSHRDVDLAALWLRWVDFLCRQPGGDNRTNILLVVGTRRVPEDRWQQLKDSVSVGTGMFATVFLRCPDEEESGYPKSASHLFLRTLEAAQGAYAGHAVFWCEADTVPMKPTWFAEIAAEYAACGKPFLGMRVGTQHPHLSGNAVYPHNWKEVAPSIATVLDAPDYKLWGPGKGQPWDVWCRKETTPQMAETKLLFQVWKERDAHATRLRDIPAQTCLFHQDKAGALIREIAAARYPEFMATLNEGRRFYMLNGHTSRLRAKGVAIPFSYQKWAVGGWRSAVCSTEVSDENAAALQTLAGKFGLREIPEAEFLKLTGRTAKSLPAPRLQPVRPVTAESPPLVEASHPSVFVMLGRYGDICNILPMLAAEAAAGRRPTLVVSQDFADILDGVSYVDRIVWDGAYDWLPDALRWLRREKGIQAPVVCQVHRHPTDKARLTDSYQKEVWRLAGRLGQFDGRLPLTFDKRDQKRERALVAAAGAKPDAPLILIGLLSHSSPLTNADAIMKGLCHVFGKGHVVVDLTKIKATRVYDLIALFDAAALLITADTLHLHLARASRVKTVALLNDGWRGSVPHEGVSVIRYAEATPAKVVDVAHDAVSPLISVKELAETIKRGNEVFGPKVIHAVDPFGSTARHHVAQSTWAMAYADGFTPAPARDFARDAKMALGDPRPLPFLKDILQVALNASKNPDDVIVWTNSDIGFAKGAAEAIGRHVRQHGAASMRRTESNGEHHVGRDLFAFTAEWLRKHWAEFPDYIIGAPVFDLGLVAMIRTSHGIRKTTMKNIGVDIDPADMPPGFALHESHDSEWHVPNHHVLPSVVHNKRLFKNWAELYAPELRFSKGGNFQ